MKVPANKSVPADSGQFDNKFSEIYNLLHHHITDVVWLYDLSSKKFTYISPSVYVLRGYTAEEALQQKLEECIHPDDYNYILAHIQPRILHYEKGNESMKAMMSDIRQPRKDGTMAWVELSSILVKNKVGKVDTIFGISRDITHKKSEDQILRDTKSLFETVFNFTATGIALLHEDGSFIDVNSGFCNMVDFPRNYVMEKTFFHFLVKGDESCVKSVFDEARQNKSLEKQTEIRLVNLQGKTIWGLLNITGVKSVKDNCLHWVIQIQETTARKKAEETIRLLNADLQHKNREMEQLVFITSHDLRSPLVNIKGFGGELLASFNELAQLMIEQTGDPKLMDRINAIGDDISESFAYINVSINKMDRLLQGLLNYSRLGKKTKNPENISMNELVAEVLKTNEFMLKNKNISLNIDLLPDCWGSEDLINQAISNLLGNAIKYLDNTRPGIIKISGYIQDQYAVYCIEDNGIGIEMQHQSKIFELFYRLYPEKGEGEGLGLSTVKKITELCKGKLELESIFGKGSIFKLYIPHHQPIKEKADIG